MEAPAAFYHLLFGLYGTGPRHHRYLPVAYGHTAYGEGGIVGLKLPAYQLVGLAHRHYVRHSGERLQLIG